MRKRGRNIILFHMLDNTGSRYKTLCTQKCELQKNEIVTLIIYVFAE